MAAAETRQEKLGRLVASGQGYDADTFDRGEAVPFKRPFQAPLLKLMNVGVNE